MSQGQQRPPVIEPFFMPGTREISPIWRRWFQELERWDSGSLGNIIGTTNQVIVTDNDDDKITLSLPQDIDEDADVIFATLTLDNTGLHLLDTNASHDLIIAPGSDITAVRILSLVTGDAARIITLLGNPTLDDWFDQAVKVASSPTFAGLTTTAGRIVNTTRLINTDSPYAVLSTDHVIFCDTDAGAITANLPAGVEGTHYKLINCGASGNDLTVDPNGTEQLYGAGAGVAATLADGEVIDIHYNATEGWF